MKRGTSFVYLFRHFNLTPVRNLICTSALQLAPVLLHLPVCIFDHTLLFSILTQCPQLNPMETSLCALFTVKKGSVQKVALIIDVAHKHSRPSRMGSLENILKGKHFFISCVKIEMILL